MADTSRPTRIDKHAIAERRRKVASLYLARQSQSAIARALGVTQQCVSLDLVALRKEWQKENVADIGAAVERETLELNQMEADAAREFAATHEAEWLNTRLRIKARRAALLGLDAPQRADLTSGGQAITGEWVTVQSVLLAALESFPDAREAAAEALLALEGPLAGR